MTTLIMSSRHTPDNQALWRAAIQRGWPVVRAKGIRLPEIDDDEVILYVEALYASTIAELVGRCLLTLPEDWLIQLPPQFKNRNIALSTLGQARLIDHPAFVKPPNDKSFAAQVYESGNFLPTEFDDEMTVLVADPVTWEFEFRCFCLDGTVVALSPYLRSEIHAQQSNFGATDGERNEVITFTESVLKATDRFTPSAVVIDVGKIEGLGWAVVEANAAWGSGIYGCDPNRVLEVIQRATLQPR